jgi:tetratricopeptide (TPR) repeat protein
MSLSRNDTVSTRAVNIMWAVASSPAVILKIVWSFAKLSFTKWANLDTVINAFPAETDRYTKFSNTWGPTVKMANDVLMIINNITLLSTYGFSAYKAIRDRNLPSDADVRCAGMESESAMYSFKLSIKEFENGSFNVALEYIDKALEEINRTANKKTWLKELEKNKMMLADMLSFKAQILIYNGKYNDAIKVLNVAIANNRSSIYIKNLATTALLLSGADIKKAEQYLRDAYHLDGNQVFSDYFLGKLANDLPRMQKAIDKMISITQPNQQPTQSLVESGGDKNFHATTPPISIFLMTMDWINSKINSCENASDLAQTLQNLNIDKLAKESGDNLRCKAMLHELEIKASLRIASLNKEIDQISNVDKEVAKSIGVESKNKKFYYEHPVERIDNSILKLFPADFNPDFLKEVKYRNEIDNVIMEWANSDLLLHDKDQNFVKIKEQMRLIKKSAKENEKNKHKEKFLEICKEQEVIDYFVKKYLSNNEWKNWFTVFEKSGNDGKLISLISLACIHYQINLRIFVREDDMIEYKAAFSNVHHDQSSQKSMDLLFDKGSRKFILLHELSTASRIFRTKAKISSWKLLSADPENHLAWDTLSHHGARALPDMADLLRKRRNITTTSGVMSSLNKFKTRCKGAATVEVKAAERVAQSINIANIPLQMYDASRFRFFARYIKERIDSITTAQLATVAIAAAAGAAVAGAVSRK